jgi:hypothetical protein
VRLRKRTALILLACDFMVNHSDIIWSIPNSLVATPAQGGFKASPGQIQTKSLPDRRVIDIVVRPE